MITLLPLAASSASPRAPLDKPNIVMMFVDDLGYGDVGFNGHPTTLTPNIDALAHGGKVLSTWYSGCPVCSCSRAALLTAASGHAFRCQVFSRRQPKMGLPSMRRRWLTSSQEGYERVTSNWNQTWPGLNLARVDTISLPL